MSHIFIDEYPILTFEFEPFIDKYWNIGLSQYIIEQYDRKKYHEGHIPLLMIMKKLRKF